jgi:hypothetical protein
LIFNRSPFLVAATKFCSYFPRTYSAANILQTYKSRLIKPSSSYLPRWFSSLPCLLFSLLGLWQLQPCKQEIIRKIPSMSHPSPLTLHKAECILHSATMSYLGSTGLPCIVATSAFLQATLAAKLAFQIAARIGISQRGHRVTMKHVAVTISQRLTALTLYPKAMLSILLFIIRYPTRTQHQSYDTQPWMSRMSTHGTHPGESAFLSGITPHPCQ